MAWTLNPSGDENGHACYEALADNTGQPQTKVQPQFQSATPGEKLYFTARVYIPTGYVGELELGFEQWDSADQQLPDYIFAIPNGELTQNAWQTVVGEMTVANPDTETIRPIFQLPGAADGGTVKISSYKIGSEYPGGVAFVAGVGAEQIKLQAQTGWELTQDNETQAHPSSVPIIAVTQHESSINALNLLDGPADPGATDGAQLGDNTYDESGLPVGDKNLKNEFTPNDNMIVDPYFSDSSLTAWDVEGSVVWHASLGEGGSTCMRMNNGVNWRRLVTEPDRDLLIGAAEGETVYVEANIWKNYVAGPGDPTETPATAFFLYCYDEDGVYLDKIDGTDKLYTNNLWGKAFDALEIDVARTRWVRIGLEHYYGELRCNWIRAVKSKPTDGYDIAPYRITSAYVSDFIQANQHGGITFGPMYNATFGGNHWWLNGNARVDALYVGNDGVRFKDDNDNEIIYQSADGAEATMQFMESQGVTNGYIHMHETNGFGFLDKSRQWHYRGRHDVDHMFYINNTHYYTMNTTALYPAADSARDLGTSSLYWRYLYVDQLRANSGSAAAPSISFGSDTNTGFHRHTTDQIGITTGGVQRAIWYSGGLYMLQYLRAINGSATAPGYLFRDDTNCGMYRITTDQIGFSTAGALRMHIWNSAVRISNRLEIPDGSVTNPSIRLTSQTNTGFYKGGGGQINYANNGAYRIAFWNSGVFVDNPYMNTGSGGDTAAFRAEGASGGGFTLHGDTNDWCQYIRYGTNWTIARSSVVNGALSDMYAANNVAFVAVPNGTIELGTTNNRWERLTAANTTVVTSDLNLKKDFEKIDGETAYLICRESKLWSFTWLDNPQQGRSFGVIAQQFVKVLEKYGFDPYNMTCVSYRDGLWGVSYSGLVPLLMAAQQYVNSELVGADDIYDNLYKEAA